MRVAIPKQFTIASHKWQVRYANPGELDDGVHGETHYERREVLLAPDLDQSFTEHTFMHELCHVIAAALGWDRFNNDEGKIDALGGMLHQFLQTKKGRL